MHAYDFSFFLNTKKAIRVVPAVTRTKATIPPMISETGQRQNQLLKISTHLYFCIILYLYIVHFIVYKVFLT